MKIERMLAVVVVLQVLILISQWTGQPSASTARAQNFNPVERQMAILDEAKSTNAKLEKILSYLQSGDMTVKVAKEDKEKK